MTKKEGFARSLLILLVLLGLGLLGIPFFLVPPAYLEIVPRDAVFASDLAGTPVRVTENATGRSLSTTIEKVDGQWLARVGRIASGPGTFTIDVEGYGPVSTGVDPAPLRTVRAAVNLVPTFGRLEVSFVRATAVDQPVAANLKRGGTTVTREPKSVVTLALPAGRHKLGAEAAGFCAGEREVDIVARQVTRLLFPLSPDLEGDEVARFILDWGEDPADLDAHFRKLGTSSFPNPAHVFYRNKEGYTGANELFATLDVDRQHSEGFETVTVYGKAQGEYEYYVHRYAGSGTIGGSGARVEAFTHGCQRRLFPVPASCAQDVWAVAHVSIKPGRVDFVDQQRCEAGVPFEAGGKVPVPADQAP
jgi:hypothetical protein